MSKLLTAEVFFDGDNTFKNSGVPGAILADRAYKRYGNPDNVPDCQGDVFSPAAVAFVNHGRWMVLCPFGCGSAQVASETDHRFFCTGTGVCSNFSVGNKAIPVLWPDPDTQELIEELLVLRPTVFRNWEPWEGLDRLELENQLKGDIL